jgi:quercetin dioxygenase-like cupin family protein
MRKPPPHVDFLILVCCKPSRIDSPSGEKTMMSNLFSHVASGCVAALVGSGVTYMSLTRSPEQMPPQTAEVQGVTVGSASQTVLFETTMDDVLGRVAMIREFERGPGLEGTPHRHPGNHTFGYVLEGTYEVRVDDGPLLRLGPGETFYEAPGALHAVSRNPSLTEPVRYLVFTVSDTTLPATVPD